MLTFRQAIEEIGKTEDGSARFTKLKNHAKVAYQDHPLGDKQCSNCAMFKAPNGCTEVEPPISPNGYCQLYELSDISEQLRQLFADPSGVGKQQPGAGDVHATTALGNEGRKRKAKDFLTTIGEMKGAKVVEVAEEGTVGKKKDRKDAKMVKVYIVRHGKTKMNNEIDTSQDRIRGWSNVPLVEEGREEARRTGKKLKKIDVGAIVASDLDRAKETADIIGEIVGVKPTTTVKLRPWDLGEFTGGSTKEMMPKIAEYIHDKPGEPVPQGESFNDFRRRAFGGLAEAIKRADGKQLVIVTHHRNERLYNAWHEAGMPDDHSIDLKEFTKKGEPPGSVMEFDVDVEALAGKQDDENAVAKQDDINAALQLYALDDGEDGMAKTPFPWDQNAMSNLRPDQTPRFLAALTDTDRLPVKTISLNSLVALQNRVDPDKVQSMIDNEPDKIPVVVRFNGRNVIADGHHRLAAHLLTGRKTAPVRFADLTAEDNAVKRMHGSEGGDIASAMEEVPGQINDSSSSIENARQELEDASNEAKDLADQEDDHEVGSKEYAQWEKEYNAVVANVADKTMALHQAVSDHLEATKNVLGQLTSIINEHARSVGVRTKKISKRFRAVVKCPECGAEKGSWHKTGCSGHILGDVEGLAKADDWSLPFEIVAKSEDQQLVFGWASVASIGGEDVVDKQGDIIPEDELEKAAYDYVLYCRQQGDMHERMGVGQLIESMVFTKQKQDVLGIDLGMAGWFCGFYVTDKETWGLIKSGERPEFSVGGRAVRVPVEEDLQGTAM